MHAFFDALGRTDLRSLFAEAIDLLAPLGVKFQPAQAKAALLKAGWKDCTPRDTRSTRRK